MRGQTLIQLHYATQLSLHQECNTLHVHMQHNTSTNSTIGVREMKAIRSYLLAHGNF